MYKNYLKVALRNLIKYKINSAITILGFSFALSVSILLFMFVSHELSADKFHKNYTNLYRFENINRSRMAPAYREHLININHAVKRIVRIETGHSGALLNYKEPIITNNSVYFADKDFFDTFSFSLISGNLKTAFNHPASIVLTESEATHIFGDENPIGKIIKFQNKHAVTVTAIIEDFPQNSSLNFSAVIPIDFLSVVKGKNWNNLDSRNFEYYMLLSSEVKPDEIAEQFSEFINENIIPTHYVKEKYLLRPFGDIYFANDVVDSSQHGNLTQLMFFSVIGLLILIIAIINFINLSISKSIKRSLEVGIRKVVGASKKLLIKQFLSESVFISFLSLALALVFVELLTPQFNFLFGSQISLSTINPFTMFLLFISGGIVLGVIAGFYPGLYLSSFHPGKVLKGDTGKKRGSNVIQKGLIVFQFFISICLISCTLFIAKQRHLLQNKELGFDKENILCLYVGSDISIKPFKKKLEKNSNVKAVAISGSFPGNGSGYHTTTNFIYKGEDKKISYFSYQVGEKYMSLMDFKLTEGRFFEKDLDQMGEACLINETAMKEFGIDDITQANFSFRGNKHVQDVGVILDYNHKSLHQKIEPMIFFYNPNLTSGFIILKLKSGNLKAINQTISYIEDVWKQSGSTLPLWYSFLDETLDNLYKKENQFQKIFNSFSILAIVIACLGLWGLVLHIAEQRTKEIGIRKVLGSSIWEICVILTKDLLKPIIVANIIAWPVAYYFMNNWLQDFAYRINLSWWIFALAGVLALGIALITVSFQAIRAARANPVEALRNE